MRKKEKQKKQKEQTQLISLPLRGLIVKTWAVFCVYIFTYIFISHHSSSIQTIRYFVRYVCVCRNNFGI